MSVNEREHAREWFDKEVRYPGYPFDCTREDARDALASAEHIRDFVRERLENH